MTTHTHSDLSGDEIPDYTIPVLFSWMGADYEIDLTTAEAERFSEALSGLLDAISAEEKAALLFSPFLNAARHVPTAVPADPMTVASVRKPRKAVAKKATASKATRTRRPAKSAAKAFSPPALRSPGAFPYDPVNES
jgi:hypothetical protein